MFFQLKNKQKSISNFEYKPILNIINLYFEAKLKTCDGLNLVNKISS